MTYFVYVLQSEEGYRYTGYTSNLERRLNEHNIGITRSTKKGRLWKIIYFEEFSSGTERGKEPQPHHMRKEYSLRTPPSLPTLIMAQMPGLVRHRPYRSDNA